MTQNYEAVILWNSPGEFMRGISRRKLVCFGFFVLPPPPLCDALQVFPCSLSLFPLPKGSFEAHQATLSHLGFAVTQRRKAERAAASFSV